jgi:hypothetical protein
MEIALMAVKITTVIMLMLAILFEVYILVRERQKLITFLSILSTIFLLMIVLVCRPNITAGFVALYTAYILYYIYRVYKYVYKLEILDKIENYEIKKLKDPDPREYLDDYKDRSLCLDLEYRYSYIILSIEVLNILVAFFISIGLLP